MKKVLGLLMIFLLIFSGAHTAEAAKKKTKLKMDQTEFVTDKDGNIEISGSTDKKAKVTIDGKNAKAKDGKFSYKYKLPNSEKTIKIVATKKGKSKNTKKIKILKPSSDKEFSQKELDQINQDLALHLSDSQGWASGTIDENGNPIENGTPNPDYELWMYVKSITFDGVAVEVDVLADFQNFSEADKEEIASSAQGMGHVYADLKKVPPVVIKNGQTIYGESKVFNRNSYTWKD